MQLSPAVVLLLLLGLALLVYALCKFVQAWYDAYSSPLAMLPNAGILAPISKLFWIFPHEYRGISTLVLPRLHDKLGPLVRIGPKTVSFYSMDIYDVVYAAGSGYRRDPRMYGEFVQGCPALFSITDKEEHARRRRMMGQLFNRNKMVGLRDIMLDEINHFITVMRQRNDWVINASAACRSFEADIISRFSFGITIGAVSSWSEGDMLGMVASNDRKAIWMPVYAHLPGLIKVWESFESVMFRFSGWRTHYTSCMEQWSLWVADAYSKTMHSSSVPPEAPNFMLTLIDAGLAPKTALSEARENLGPGTDTTSSTLAHILFALSHCPCFQQKLREELVNLEFPTDFTNLESCPKLTACIKEGIRWAGAASAMLPRVVPPEGAVLAGHFLPGGTIITSSPTWYLRDNRAYPCPFRFNPYRWLTADGSALSKDNDLRDRHYIPFSKGSNFCTGTHYACYQLYLALSQILKHFHIGRPQSIGPRAVGGVQEPHCALVQLPCRREWVAAVPIKPLNITLEPLDDVMVQYYLVREQANAPL